MDYYECGVMHFYIFVCLWFGIGIFLGLRMEGDGRRKMFKAMTKTERKIFREMMKLSDRDKEIYCQKMKEEKKIADENWRAFLARMHRLPESN